MSKLTLLGPWRVFSLFSTLGERETCCPSEAQDGGGASGRTPGPALAGFEGHYCLVPVPCGHISSDSILHQSLAMKCQSDAEENQWVLWVPVALHC